MHYRITCLLVSTGYSINTIAEDYRILEVSDNLTQVTGRNPSLKPVDSKTDSKAEMM
jgi:hypothetical protein